MSKNNTKRLFLAATLDHHWQKKITHAMPFLAELHLPTLKYIAQEKYHITIHFWPDANLAQTKTIIDCTENIC